MKTLADRLGEIATLEGELVDRFDRIPIPKHGCAAIDFFAIGALNRTLSQSQAFRTLVENWNISSAHVIARAQLDTALRINGLRHLQDRDAAVEDLFYDRVKYRHLRSSSNQKMTDVHLRELFARDHPWVDDVYTELSDHVHLSFSHLWPAVQFNDREERLVQFNVSGLEPNRDETKFYNLTDRFHAISALSSTLLVSLMRWRWTGNDPSNRWEN